MPPFDEILRVCSALFGFMLLWVATDIQRPEQYRVKMFSKGFFQQLVLFILAIWLFEYSKS